MDMTTNEAQLLQAAITELQTISARWSRNDLPNNPVRQVTAILLELEAEEPGSDHEVIWELVQGGEHTEETVREALARHFGTDEEGRDVREDGDRS